MRQLVLLGIKNILRYKRVYLQIAAAFFMIIFSLSLGLMLRQGAAGALIALEGNDSIFFKESPRMILTAMRMIINDIMLLVGVVLVITALAYVLNVYTYYNRSRRRYFGILRASGITLGGLWAVMLAELGTVIFCAAAVAAPAALGFFALASRYVASITGTKLPLAAGNAAAYLLTGIIAASALAWGMIIISIKTTGRKPVREVLE